MEARHSDLENRVLQVVLEAGHLGTTRSATCELLAVQPAKVGAVMRRLRRLRRLSFDVVSRRWRVVGRL